MNSNNNTTRILGIAFLAQFIISIIAMSTGIMLKLDLMIVQASFSERIASIADNVWLFNTNILTEMLTALTIVFLASALYSTLKKWNQKIAVAGLGLYFIAAAILASTRMYEFSLLRISREYISSGQPFLQTTGNNALEYIDFGVKLLAFPYILAAVLFCFLLYKSKLVPRFFPVWGIIGGVIGIAGSIITLYGYDFPFVLNLPYGLFEPAIGIWILLKGIKE